jgi:hypothetical protein
MRIRGVVQDAPFDQPRLRTDITQEGGGGGNELPGDGRIRIKRLWR